VTGLELCEHVRCFRPNQFEADVQELLIVVEFPEFWFGGNHVALQEVGILEVLEVLLWAFESFKSARAGTRPSVTAKAPQKGSTSRCLAKRRQIGMSSGTSQRLPPANFRGGVNGTAIGNETAVTDTQTGFLAASQNATRNLQRFKVFEQRVLLFG
jgi:hypothetical protein